MCKFFLFETGKQFRLIGDVVARDLDLCLVDDLKKWFAGKLNRVNVIVDHLEVVFDENWLHDF